MSPPDLLDPADPADALALRPWLALQSALCFRPDLAVALLHEHGDPERALRASGAPPVARRRDRAVARDPAPRARRGAAALRRARIRPASRDYPDAAPLLLVQGDPAALVGAGHRDRGVARGHPARARARARLRRRPRARRPGGDLGPGARHRRGGARGRPGCRRADHRGAGLRSGSGVSGGAPPPREPDRVAGRAGDGVPARNAAAARALPASQPSDQRPGRGAARDRGARAERHAGDHGTRGGAGPRRLRAARPGRRGGLRRLEPTAARRSARRARTGGRARRAAPGRSAARAARRMRRRRRAGRPREPARWARRSSPRSSALPHTATSSRAGSRARPRSWRSRSSSSSSPVGSARSAMEDSASYRRAERVSYDRALRAEGTCRSSRSSRTNRGGRGRTSSSSAPGSPAARRPGRSRGAGSTWSSTR